MSPEPEGSLRCRVVIVGGGVAGIEAALCLNDLAGDLVSTTIVAPNEDFVYLPAGVPEPFERPMARRYPLAKFAEAAGAELCVDTFAWVDSDFFVVHTTSGEQLSYDALLLAPGANAYANFRYVMTLDPYRIDEQMSEIRQDIQSADVHKLAFVIPDGPVWPLPIYELALLSAAHAQAISADIEITIITPEPAPLAVFGAAVADHVAQLIDAAGITIVLSTRSSVQGPGLIALHPDPVQSREPIHADRIMALPQLFGPHCAGVPTTAIGGFISTDRQQRVPRIGRVYAAGDATDFPIKFGAIAAEQADVAAQSIAALAGADIQPVSFEPELHAVLLTGGPSLMLDAHPSGSTATHSRVSEASDPVARGKITARYLEPYLQALDRAVAPGTVPLS